MNSVNTNGSTIPVLALLANHEENGTVVRLVSLPVTDSAIHMQIDYFHMYNNLFIVCKTFDTIKQTVDRKKKKTTTKINNVKCTCIV